MTPPKIGITTSLNEDEQRLDLAYVHAVERAGGTPLIVPVLQDATNASAFAGMLDGLIITGGPAIESNLVGTLPSDINATDPRRTQNDQWVLEAFLSAQKPVLGICYGMQLINAHFGGSIYADVEAELALKSTHSKTRGAVEHGLVVQQGTHLERILATSPTGTTLEQVNTRHIQALATPGAGLTISAYSDDGVIEAIETQDGRLIGVQFHPEGMGISGYAYFENLIRECQTTTP